MAYRAPTIPETPSDAINQVLVNRFTAPPDNVFKAVVAHFVCAEFNSILLTYRALKRGATTDSFQLWAAACALVSLALAMACFFAYKILMASAFLLQGTVRYGLGSLALLGIGMGVAGILFFDRSAPVTAATVSSAKQAEKTLGYEDYEPAAKVVHDRQD